MLIQNVAMAMMHDDGDSHANRIHSEMVATRNLFLVKSSVAHTVNTNQMYLMNILKLRRKKMILKAFNAMQSECEKNQIGKI